MAITSRKDKEAALFLGFVFAILVSIFFIIYFKIQFIVAIMIIAALVIAAIILLQGRLWVQVMDYEKMVVFRQGIFNRVEGPGWKLIIPGLETYTIVDTRVKEVNIPPQKVHSKDGMSFTVDCTVYLRVTDPKKAILEVDDYTRAIMDFVISRIRDVIGKMPWEEVIGNLKEINELIKKETAEVSKKWGIDIVKVEITNIVLPEEVQQAIRNKEAAERQKLARKELAEGEAMRLHAINQVTKDMNPAAIQYLYLESLKALADGKANKLILPVELSKLAESLSEKIGKSKDEVLKELVELAKEEHLLK